VRHTVPRRAPSPIEKRSNQRIVYFDIVVKSWVAALPSVGAVRPARCVECGAPGAPAGGPIGLHGHGVRSRQQLGPLELGDAPRARELLCRRYECQRCGAVMLSVPRGVLPRRWFTAVAMALALALWSAGESSRAVRDAVSAPAVVGDDGRRQWRSLSRWARAAPTLWPLGLEATGPPRELASKVVTKLAALAPLSSGVVLADACAGALRC